MNSSPTKQLVSFGFIMAVAAFILAWLYGRWDWVTMTLTALGAAFVSAALLAPRLLDPFYRRWMRLGEALGWFNTRLILIMVYYLVVTPIGLVWRLFRRSPLAVAERDGSFWSAAERHSWGDRHFEKQF